MNTPPQRAGSRDRFLFRFLVTAICALPLLLIIVVLSRGHSSSAEFDAISGLYCVVGLLLVVALLIFCFRVWKRNRRMALFGFALIAAIVLSWLFS